MEHRVILGGEQYLPFARSRIRALRATGLLYASQKFDLGDATVTVQIEPGHEYIRLEGGVANAVAYSSVNYPIPQRTVGPDGTLGENTVTVGPSGVPGAKTVTGGDAAASAGDFPWRPYETHYASSPFSKDAFSVTSHKWTGYSTSMPVLPIPALRGTITHEIRLAGKLIESPSIVNDNRTETWSESPSNNGQWRPTFYDYHSTDYPAGYLEFVPTACAGPRPVLAAIVQEATEHEYGEGFGQNAICADVQLVDGSRGNRLLGRTFIRLWMVDGEGAVTTADCAPLPLKDSEYQSTQRTITHSVQGDDGTLLSDSMVSKVSSVTEKKNSLCPDPFVRQWYALERVSVDQSGGVYVLRETSDVKWETGALDDGWGSGPPVPGSEFDTTTTTRGLTLSYVRETGQVADNVFSADIGEFGFVGAVIPDASLKKVFVYYLTHRAGSDLPVPETAKERHLYIPTQFSEHLAEITREILPDGGSIFTLTRTVDLGAITLRKTLVPSVDGDVPLTDLHEARLHGAATAANELIWADRYCYNVKTGRMMQIPGALGPPQIFPPHDYSLNQITGSAEDYSSYLVTPNPRTAMYVGAIDGVVRVYGLSIDPDTQEETVTLRSEKPSGADARGALTWRARPKHNTRKEA